MKLVRNISSKPNVQINEEKVPINFDIKSLNLFCTYVLSENAYIRMSALSNTKKLFDRMEMSIYQNDPERLTRIEFIKRALEAKVDKKIKNRDMVEKYINGGLEDKPLLDTTFIKELSTNEIEWINDTISESLKYSFMYKYVDKIAALCAKFKAEDYRRRGDIVGEFENVIDELKKEFRRSNNENLNDAEFSLAEGIFEELIADIYAREINPSRRLLTGMQGFNELVGGGLESGRVYMLFGNAGVGKSLTLLNIAYQIKKYNKNYICHDKTKKPCIVLLTMENSIHETITRLFSMITNDTMKNYDLDDVIRKFREEGELTLSDDSPIDIFIKYKPNLSVDTSYLYTLADSLEEKGYEIICLLQDHVKRIRPAFQRGDIRLDLGEVVNDFKVFANEKDIPVISDSHLNREGARTVDMASASNKQDVTRLLGRANVGESMLMIDNADCGIILNNELDKQGRKYMAFLRIKMRDKCTSNDLIIQPFMEDSTIRLVEDLYDPIPSFKFTLHETKNMVTGSDYTSNMIRSYDDDDEDSIFANRIQEQPEEQPLVIHSGMPTNPSEPTKVIGNPSKPIYPMPDDIVIHNQIANTQMIVKMDSLKHAVLFFDDDGNEIDITPMMVNAF